MTVKTEQDIFYLNGIATDLMNDWVDDRNRKTIAAEKLSLIDTSSKIKWLLNEIEAYNG